MSAYPETQQWIPLQHYGVPDIGDYMILVKHKDGKEGVERCIDGQIYLFDSISEAPITHYKIKYPLSLPKHTINP